jgi:phosphatidylserine/phosphatidylglycerophosphate/cardiolipin synthase-like enzyme
MRNLVIAVFLWALPVHAAERMMPVTKVYFSPQGGCTKAVVDVLSKAKTSINVQTYSFTSAPIAKALVDAHKRGVKVQVILDKSQKTERYTSATPEDESNPAHVHFFSCLARCFATKSSII